MIEILQWRLKYFRGVGEGDVVEKKNTLTFFRGLEVFFRGLHIDVASIPRGMSFLSA